MSLRALARTLLLPALAFALAAPAAADFRLERKLPLAPGGELVVKAEGGAITVTGDAVEGATIVITSRRDDVAQRYRFDFDAQPGRVVVESKKLGSFAGRWFDLSWGGERLHFAISVPRETKVTLGSSGGGIKISDLAGAAQLRSSGGGLRVADVAGDVDARTSGGGIDVRHLLGSLRAHTSGGGIVVANVSGDVEVDTSGGGIEIDSVGGSVDAGTSGGGVRIRGVHGRVDAQSSGGSVSAVFAAGSSAGGKLSSSGGGVRVAVDPSAALSIDASSSGGGVTCDLPVTVQGRVSRGALRGHLNGGGPTLELRSSGGGITIAPLGASS